MSRADQLRSAFGVIHILPLEKEDADVILELAQLVVHVDGSEDSDEVKLYFTIGQLVYDLADIKESVPTFASDQEDDERLFELSTALRSTESRELAFVVARALAEANLEIVAAEEKFISQLRSLLSISKERAEELDFLLRSA
jgi:hypothetical protein